MHTWAVTENAIGRPENLVGAFSLAVADRLVAVTQAAAQAGVSAPAALSTLLTYSETPISIERLRTIIGLSHSTTVRLVDTLCEEGLVERQPGGDGRERSLRLTRRGTRVAQRVRDERAALLAAIVATLDRNERRQLEALLAGLLETMVGSRTEARLICRLCDHDVCARRGSCPVDAAATALGE
jgi:MarR family transcriptional regulator, negative regulator of the multidrug operon emrRAB